MKILLVLEATLGGTGRHILDLSQGLLDRGHEVHLVYSTLRADERFLAGLRCLRAARPELRVYCLPIAHELSFSDVRSYWKLARYLRRRGPFDIIHSHSTKAGFLARLPARRRGAHSVYTPHGLMTLNPELVRTRRRAACWLESMLARWSDAIITISENERRCAIDTGIDPEKLKVIPNGVDPLPNQEQLRQQIRGKHGLPPATFHIGWVGRLVPYKCPDRMIESLALLRLRCRRPIHLVMIGAGPLEGALRKQAKHLGIDSAISFLGTVDGPLHMAALDVLAHTSLFEGFSYVFLEAMSAGVPVVATRVGGTDEMIEHSITGYVCDPWDANTFAALLERVADDLDQRGAMAQAARQRAARFSATAMIDCTEQLYASLCAKPDPLSRRSLQLSRTPE